MEYFYHGTNDKITDSYFKYETFFTKDILVAKNYGSFIYFIDLFKI